MKRIHLILLVMSALVACCSVYSLAVVNKVYKIDFEWYSQYRNGFTDSRRDVSQDKWQQDGNPRGMSFDISVIGSIPNPGSVIFRIPALLTASLEEDHYIYIHGTLGKEASPEYRLKFAEVAQRGGVVEVRVSMNSPERREDPANAILHDYMPEDRIRINPDEFAVKGELLFIFKNQDGKQLYQRKAYIG